MTTTVFFKRVFQDNGYLLFRTWELDEIIVKSFNEGIMVIDSYVGSCFYRTAQVIAGCFEQGSEFKGLRAIETEFKGVYISVNPENAQLEKILQIWEDGWKKNCEESKKIEKEYENMKSYF